jgi:hypothetical protein
MLRLNESHRNRTVVQAADATCRPDAKPPRTFAMKPLGTLDECRATNVAGAQRRQPRAACGRTCARCCRRSAAARNRCRALVVGRDPAAPCCARESLTPMEKAERRVLVLANPGRGPRQPAGVGDDLPRRAARAPGRSRAEPSAHARTPRASCIEGEGAVTLVGGEAARWSRAT